MSNEEENIITQPTIDIYQETGIFLLINASQTILLPGYGRRQVENTRPIRDPHILINLKEEYDTRKRAQSRIKSEGTGEEEGESRKRK